MELTTVVTGAWNAFATKITIFLPKLIGAIIIFVVGLIVAKLIKMGVVKLLKLVRSLFYSYWLNKLGPAKQGDPVTGRRRAYCRRRGIVPRQGS